LQGTNGMGVSMAIFSKKHRDKKPDSQTKVSADASVEAKATEKQASATVEDEAAKEASATHGEAQAPPLIASADAGSGTVSAPLDTEASHEVVEPEPLVTPPVERVERRFGIDDAIQLMRSLPPDPNMGLVVRVVRVTLGAVHVSIEDIVEDAIRKETRIKERIATIETQIADLEKQLANLRREVAAHQSDLKETANVRERLHMADQYPLNKTMPPPITSLMPRSTPSKPVTS